MSVDDFGNQSLTDWDEQRDCIADDAREQSWLGAPVKVQTARG
ncbi:hypothetical protein [Natronosalvus halobius]|nr:hypothetical protein [Natronosalvus halobius]